jgi:ubiquinone/menaquinone biosynthesis C-methylase UbiE
MPKKIVNSTNFMKVADQIKSKSMFQKKAVDKIIDTADEQFLIFAEDVTTRMLKAVGMEKGIEYLAEAYLWYTKTIKIEELFFAKERRYRYSDYDEVYGKVYGDDNYMREYVVGLGMTQVFWANHYRIFRFFLDTFIPLVTDAQSGAEVGVGHGQFHAELLRHCPQLRSTLLDVSPISLDMTRKVIKVTGLNADRATPVLCDAQKEIPLEDNSLDVLLMGELIEHIQDGQGVMSKIAKKLKPGGYCYFSTAANSPAEDHILLFKSVDEIRQFVKECGWKVIAEHLGTVDRMSVEQAEKEGHNINYASVLTKE